MSDTSHDADSVPQYVLGHSDREIERLKTQARLIDPITQRFFHEAGITPGMRVLDVGTGAGDVAFLAAAIVGDKGEVVGVDRVPAALEAARARASARSLHNVIFREGDPGQMMFEQPFDAVIGRYVLQFQKDPATMLRTLARHARPGEWSPSTKSTGAALGRLRQLQSMTDAAVGALTHFVCTAPKRGWDPNCIRRSWPRDFRHPRCDWKH